MSLAKRLVALTNLWLAFGRNRTIANTQSQTANYFVGARPSLHALGLVALVVAVWLHNQQQLPNISGLLAALASLQVIAALWWLWGKRYQWLNLVPTIVAHGSVSLILLTGWVYEAQERIDRRWPTEKNGEIHWVTGSIESMIQTGDYGVQFKFRAQAQPTHVEFNAQTFNVSWAQALPDLRPGQRWRLQLKISAPTGVLNFNGPDAAQYALQQQVDAIASVYRGHAQRIEYTSRWYELVHIEALRQLISEHLDHVSGPNAQRTVGIVKALTIGEQSAITSEDWQLFNKTGVSHLMSISGLHVTMMALICAWLFKLVWNTAARWCPLRWLPYFPNRKTGAWVCAIFAAWGYCVLAGWGVPAQRTLFTLIVLGALVQKQTVSSQQEALFALQWVLLIILLLDSWAVLTIGFWLSFLAVASLMLQSVGRLKRQASQPLTVANSSMPAPSANSSFKNSIGQLVLSACLSQWACTIGLLVPLLYFFGASSAVSPLANAVAIPLISMVVTPLALIAAFFAVVWQSVFSAWPELNPALKILALNDFLLAYLLQYLESVAGLRGLWFVSGELPFALAALLTCGLLGSLALGSIKRQAGLVAFSLSGLMLYIAIAQTLRQKQEHWELTFMDVGQGSSILVQHKNRAMLIDTGPRRSLNQDSVRSIVLPTLAAQQVRALDWLVVTHQDMAHSGGLRSLLHGIPVKTIVASLPKHSYEQHLFDSKASNKDQKVDTCEAGNFYEFGDLRVQVLSPFLEPSSPQHPDDMSCVLLIEGYGSRVLLPADIRRQSQQRLIRQYGEQLRANVLAMPGQGSKTAFNHEFVAAVAPSYAVAQVASVSKGNRWRHPEAVLPAYTEVGATVFRTDHHGAIKFRFSTNEPPLVTWARATRARYWHF